MISRPIAIFSALAAAALGALGTSAYVAKLPVGQFFTTKSMEAAAPQKPAETTIAISKPAEPIVTLPKAEEPAKVAMVPAPEKPAEIIVMPEVALEQPPMAKAETPAVSVETVPAFDTVRVEPSGDAVIAGRADPGAEVVVKLNGAVVGATTSSADGSFVVIPEKPLAVGTGALTLEMTKNSGTVTSESSVIVAIKGKAPALVAKIDPVAPTTVLQSTEVEAGPLPKDVQLNAVDYDSAGNIVFCR